MRRIPLLVLLAVLLALGGMTLIRFWPDPNTIVVVRGDTLSILAARHGVTVEDLRAWNGIEGDLIEVGQRLSIPGGQATADVERHRPPPRPGRTPPTKPAPSGLRMPAAKPCLSGPEDGAADLHMAASQGLTQIQARKALDAFVPNVLTCLAGVDPPPRAALELALLVGCDGRVDRVDVEQRADWPPEVSRCVAGILRHTPFPAHGLPDGELVLYPLRYTPP